MTTRSESQKVAAGRFRVSISTVMAVVVVIASDAAIIRALLRSQGTGLPALFQARALLVLGILPMASLLVVIALVTLPKLIRTGAQSALFWGFEVCGGAALVGFVLLSVLIPAEVNSYLEFGVEPFRRMIMWSASRSASLLGRMPTWLDFFLEDGLDCAPIALVFGVPQLGIALLGGWLARRVGISIRIEARQTRDKPPIPAESRPMTVRTGR